ncbi:hypothetical protein SCLCIDRAFT_1213200 [Scleroderma citrinum Foug A]|uniref:Uncharacterized protein n=1 Tax=Scleroderma citrinum Foug A TaxID=1036808 RepID=A0A0C2ZT44_9AGAM|nr:hypothetical protein SCLCIDRAFT_1213200 [Scleroderma citrinum Foug A]
MRAKAAWLSGICDGTKYCKETTYLCRPVHPSGVPGVPVRSSDLDADDDESNLNLQTLVERMESRTLTLGRGDAMWSTLWPSTQNR